LRIEGMEQFKGFIEGAELRSRHGACRCRKRGPQEFLVHRRGSGGNSGGRGGGGGAAVVNSGAF
jgi:hypothetical protein